jgi:hypothetical protein
MVSSEGGDAISLLCDQPVIVWAGVKVKDAQEQSVRLRNNSVMSRLEVVVNVGPDPSGSFKLAGFPGPRSPSHVIRNTLGPQEECEVKLLFTPTQCKVSHSALMVSARAEIVARGNGDREEGASSASTAIRKFNIPMMGYGGRSHLIVEGSRISGEQHRYVDGGFSLGSLQAGKLYTMTTKLRNKGDRAAYVRALFTDAEGVELPSRIGKISPPGLIIQARRSRVIRTSFRMSEDDLARLAQHSQHNQNQPSTMAMLKLYSGDELLRAHFRNSLQGGRVQAFDEVAETFPLELFDEYFDGEELVRFGPDVRDDSDGRGVALGFGSVDALQLGTTCIQLAIVGSGSSCSSTSAKVVIQSAAHHGDGRPSTDRPQPEPNRASLSPPTRALAPGRPPPKVSPARSDTTVVLGTRWTAGPDLLKFTNQEAQHFTIRNGKPGPLEFEIISSPAYTLVCNPPSGIVHARSELIVEVTARVGGNRTTPVAPSKALPPWSGRIFVYADGLQMAVDVQISPKVLRQNLKSMRHRNDNVRAISPPVYQHAPMPNRARIAPHQRQQTQPKQAQPHNTTHHRMNHGNKGRKKPITLTTRPRIDVLHGYGHAEQQRQSPRSGEGRGGGSGLVAPPSFGSDLDGRDEELYAALAATHTVRFAVASGGQQQHHSNPHPRDTPHHQKQPEVNNCEQTAVARLSNEPVEWDAPESSHTSVYFGQGGLQFKPVLVGTTKAKNARICNKSANVIMVKFAVTGTAFAVSHRSITLQPFSYIQLPIVFAPPTSGHHRGTLLASFDSRRGVVELALPVQGSTKDLVWK